MIYNILSVCTCHSPVLHHLLQIKGPEWEICLFLVPNGLQTHFLVALYLRLLFFLPLVCNKNPLPTGKILAQNSLKSRRWSGVIFLQPWHPPLLIFYLHLKLIHFQSFKSDILFQLITQQILLYIYYIPNVLLCPEDKWKIYPSFCHTGLHASFHLSYFCLSIEGNFHVHLIL